MNKALSAFLAVSLTLTAPAYAAGTVGDFVKEVLTKVAVSIIADAVKGAFSPKGSAQPPAVDANEDDKSRTRRIILSLIDSSLPISEKVGYYATRVDYFRSGVVDHSFILSDQARYEKRWPQRRYELISVDEIAVAPDRTYAVVRYTLGFHVANDSQARTGSSKVALVIGTFNSQPRIHAIKEWIQPSRQ